MIKKILLALGCMIVLGVVLAAFALWYSRTSNPWEVSCIGEIPVPHGYKRIEAPKGSYTEWLRALPLKPRGSKVKLYTGGNAQYQLLSTGVIDLPLLSNAEQCADMTMRFRAEYFYNRGNYSKIHFTDVNGKQLQYRGGGSRKAFEKYLRKAYGQCSTFSVHRETTPRKISEVEPGDVLVYPARDMKRLGHALIVVDVARKGNKVAIMCAEGNTPAREAHVVRNLSPLHNPWFFFDGDEKTFWVSLFHFNKNELRHY